MHTEHILGPHSRSTKAKSRVLWQVKLANLLPCDSDSCTWRTAEKVTQIKWTPGDPGGAFSFSRDAYFFLPVAQAKSLGIILNFYSHTSHPIHQQILWALSTFKMLLRKINVFIYLAPGCRPTGGQPSTHCLPPWGPWAWGQQCLWPMLDTPQCTPCPGVMIISWGGFNPGEARVSRQGSEAGKERNLLENLFQNWPQQQDKLTTRSYQTLQRHCKVLRGDWEERTAPCLDEEVDNEWCRRLKVLPVAASSSLATYTGKLASSPTTPDGCYPLKAHSGQEERIHA